MAKKNNDLASERKIHIINDKTSPFVVTESFRKITTNIGFAIPKKEDGSGKIFCVTSAIAGEGKTTISVNLALSCAKSGAKTVLLDCDFRKPSVKRYFPSDNKKGVEAYLSGQTNFENIVYKDPSSWLDVIATMHCPPNPISLLNSSGYDSLLEWLKQNYDYVIIDTPPLALVSDASIIGKKTDGVIIVTRQMYSNHKVLKDVVNQLEFAKCNILGFILNDFAVSSKSYYGGRYGKYGTYGKYSYKQAEKKDSNK